MQSTDTQTDATADLEKLSAEMATLGFQATLRAPQGDTACLTVRNPRASVLTEMVYAASIQREFPGWVCWRGASAMVYARRAKRPRNSGYDAKGEDAMDLRDQIIRAEALAHDEQA